MKLKISKVVPVASDKSGVITGDVFEINGNKYYTSSSKLEDNFTGFSINLLILFTLPDNQYQYLKTQVRAQSLDFKQVIAKKQQIFKEIKKNNCRRNILFTFTPPHKGSYRVLIEAFYKLKNIFQPNQTNQQKKQILQVGLKSQQPFQINQKIVSENQSGSISFPLFVQYTIESKLIDQQLQFKTSFQSTKFNFLFLNNENNFTLNKGQVFYVMLELQPKSIKQIFNEKGIILGNLKLEYGDEGKCQKKTSLKQTDKYIFFKGETITKSIPKKDIANVKIKFSKIYNVDFGLKDMKIIIEQKDLYGVKIIKTSQQVLNLLLQTINLDKTMSVIIQISVICMKSGHFHLKGLFLQTEDGKIVNYCNQLTFVVKNQQQNKFEPSFQKTTYVQIDNLL